MVCPLKAAGPVLICPGKGPFYMPEELALDKVVRNGRAIYCYKRLIFSGAVIMDRFGYKLLSCPTLPLNQYCTFGLCNRREDIHYLFHPPVFCYNITEMIYSCEALF